MSSQDQTQRDEGTGPIDNRLQTSNIWETAERIPEIGRFVEAVRVAGLDHDLKTADFKTLFAPTDEAMEQAPPDESPERLRGTFARYVVMGKQTVADLRTTSTLKPLEGPPVQVSYENGAGMFGGAGLVRSDIACTNGQIHIIDKLVS